MCLATAEAAGANLYEALHFQHSLGRLEATTADFYGPCRFRGA
jgi:hypothetical protein